MQSYNLPTNDAFNDAFNDFQETAIFQRLEDKFKPVPYYKKFKALRMTALFSGFVFNAFSALTAATLVYFFILKLTGYAVLAGIITLIFTVILEVSKRFIASRFFQNKLQYGQFAAGLFTIGVLLTGLSVCFSFFGSQKSVQTFTPPPVVADIGTATASQQAQMNEIQKQIKEARKTTYRGKTTAPSQRTIEKLTDQLNALTAQKIKIENETSAENKILLSTHTDTTDLNAYHFALVTLLLEFMFLLCAWYLEYYDFRSLAEFAFQFQQKKTITNDMDGNDKKDGSTGKLARAGEPEELQKSKQLNGSGATGTPIDENIIQLAMKKVRNKITTARYRLRNDIGREETNKKNEREAKEEFEQLQNTLVATS